VRTFNQDAASKALINVIDVLNLDTGKIRVHPSAHIMTDVDTGEFTASTHNSGVLHAGLYYQPGSLKARLAVSGVRMMTEFCRHHGVAHEICGKVVVATSADELPSLERLWDRGQRNGLRGLRRLNSDELREIEPHAAGVAAVQVPEEGIVDYAGVCAALRCELEAAGVGLCVGCGLIGRELGALALACVLRIAGLARRSGSAGLGGSA
jgi:hypothetical protein